jgi:hypothetical protein
MRCDVFATRKAVRIGIHLVTSAILLAQKQRVNFYHDTVQFIQEGCGMRVEESILRPLSLVARAPALGGGLTSRHGARGRRFQVNDTLDTVYI